MTSTTLIIIFPELLVIANAQIYRSLLLLAPFPPILVFLLYMLEVVHFAVCLRGQSRPSEFSRRLTNILLGNLRLQLQIVDTGS